MNHLENSDLVSAFQYIGGELTDAECVEFEARLLIEPQLADELIRAARLSLAASVCSGTPATAALTRPMTNIEQDRGFQASVPATGSGMRSGAAVAVLAACVACFALVVRPWTSGQSDETGRDQRFGHSVVAVPDDLDELAVMYGSIGWSNGEIPGAWDGERSESLVSDSDEIDVPLWMLTALELTAQGSFEALDQDDEANPDESGVL